MQPAKADPGRAAAALLAAQNRDGGWGYGAGGESWTEPTAYAILGLRAHGDSSGGVEQGVAWLKKTQRPEGGWAPNPGVEVSTWVTALALLVLRDNPRALGWLMDQSGRESGILERIRMWMLGARPDLDSSHRGWPWFPGASAWVAPTAFSILALRRYDSAPAKERLAAGREYLLSRMCGDGGWNHGSTRALGYEASSYPETTGLALLALRGVSNLERSIARAREHMRECRSAQGVCWLRLGLRAHGHSVPMQETPRRNQLDVALYLLAAAAEGNRNPLLEA